MGATESATTIASNIQRRRRLGLLVSSLLYSFLFIGAFYGWGPMQLFLEENGSFSYKCIEKDADEICPEQTDALTRIQFISHTTALVSPVFGRVADKYGTPIASYIMTALFLAGLAILLISTSLSLKLGSSPASDLWLYVGFVLMVLSTWMDTVLAVHTGVYFTGRARHRVISILNAFNDAGSVTYLGLWKLRQAFGLSLQTILSGYLLAAALTFGAGSYYWTVAVPSEDEEERQLQEWTNAVKEDDDNSKSAPSPIAGELESLTAVVGKELQSRTESEDSSSCYSYTIVADRTPRQQLTSGPALCFAVFFAVQATADDWTLTTTRDFLASLGDDSVGNRYLSIYTLLLPASILGLPFVDLVINRYGFYYAFQGINVLALAYNLIRLCSDNLNVQIAGFVCFSLFRCFLLSVGFSYIPVLFSEDVIGLATGLLIMLPGLTAFFNIALGRLTITRANGDFFMANLFYTLLVLPCIACTFGLGRGMRREDLAKTQRSDKVSQWVKDSQNPTVMVCCTTSGTEADVVPDA